MKLKSLFKGMVLSIPLLLTSCNDEESVDINSKCRIVISVDKFESTIPTRTNTDPDNGFLITWASGDVIGIFPREGYQEPFEIPAEQIGHESASFDGGYWAVKNGLQYNAYYPFDKRNFDSAEMKTKIPVTYIGQKQNGTSCDIGAFDYTYSDWGTATNGSIGFDFHHIGAIAVFSLEYPATTTYTKMTLTVDEALIPLEGSYDLTANDVSFVADENSKAESISLNLENCSGIAGETGIFYMMLPPMDLSNNTVTLSLTSTTGKICTYSIDKVLNTKKGKLYRRTGKPIKSNVEGTVDGWREEVSSYANGVAFVANAGELSSIIPDNEKHTITSLKIFGELNGTDIKFIRENMAKCYINNNTESFGTLKTLDLSEASIVEGGEAYYSSYTTENNVLGNSMFNGSATLESVILPKNITTIESKAFRNCSNLRCITIFENVKSIGANAFIDSNLSEITIPEGVETIESGAFCRCNLSEIIIPEGVKTIGDNAFYNIENLKTVSIPQSVTSIGENAFGYHRGIDVYIKDLRKFLEACISESTIFIPKNDGAYYRLFLNNVEVKDLIIPEGVTGIPYFARCSSFISVTLPEGAYCKIAGNFSECKNLEQAKFPNSYLIIPPGTFANSGLKTMTIGNNVTTIYYGAFSYCPLNAFYSYTQTPPILDCIPEGMNTSNMPTEIRYSFGGVNKDNATLYVPAGCKTAYESSDWAKYFGTIVEMN